MTKILSIFAIFIASFSGFAYASPPTDADDMMDQLEEMGYDVSMDTKHIIAKHHKELNIFLKKYYSGTLVTAYFTTNRRGKRHQDDLLVLINKLNRVSPAARFYLDGDGDIVIEGYYPGRYRHKSFKIFLDTFNHCRTDIADMSDKILKYLK